MLQARYRPVVAARPPFVPDEFEPPRRLASKLFVLEPLGPRHNEADYAAWMSSLVHIRATPGFVDGSWPHEMSLAENLGDLVEHAEDFATRRGFTYTVLDPDGNDVIGCVYIYPVGTADSDAAAVVGVHDASVRSWVRADWVALDVPLWRVVTDWIARDWPFEHVAYAPRP